MSDNHEHDLPDVDRVAEKEPKSTERWKNNAQRALSDPSAKSTLRMLIAFALFALFLTFVMKGCDGNDTSSRSVTERPLEQLERSQESMLTADEEAAIIEENEQKRQEALSREHGYTPNRMALLDNSVPNTGIAGEVQSQNICERMVDEGIKAGMSPDEILESAIHSAVEMAKKRGLTQEAILALSQECAAYVADKLDLDTQETIKAAAKAAQLAAAQMGLSEEDQVRLAAEAAQATAAKLGLSEEEQVAAAAKAAQDAAAALGWSEERQVEAAAKAAQKAAANLGWSEEEQVAAAAKAAQQAAKSLGWSEERQVEAAAKAAQAAAASLGWSEERQVEAAAKAAQAAAASLGWSEERQVEAAAKAAQQAAARLGWSEEEQVAAAAKAAQQAAASLGWSKERQIEAAAKAAQQAAKDLGWSEEEQIDAAAAAARATAAALGLDKNQQVAAAAKAAAEAAGHLGWDKDKQVLAAAKAAHDAAQVVGLTPEQTLEAVGRAVTEAGLALGLDQEEIADLRDAAIGKSGDALGLGSKEKARAASTMKMDESASKKEEPQFSKHQIAAMVEDRILVRQEGGAERPVLDYRQTATITQFPEPETAGGGDGNAVTAEGRRDFSTNDFNQAANEAQEQTKEGQDSPQEAVVHAGDFLYGIQLTRVNTDVPAEEVVATIIGGPFNGAKAIGQWTKNSTWGETVGLVFNRLNYKGHEIANVELVAFHPKTDLPGFATDVDHHYLQRFVGVAMRALGAGASAAIQARRETQQRLDEFGNLTGVTQQALDYELARDLFFARGAQEIGTFGERYENRPITVDVHNEEMKLLVLQNLYYPEELQDEW